MKTWLLSRIAESSVNFLPFPSFNSRKRDSIKEGTLKTQGPPHQKGEGFHSGYVEEGLIT